MHETIRITMVIKICTTLPEEVDQVPHILKYISCEPIDYNIKMIPAGLNRVEWIVAWFTKIWHNGAYLYHIEGNIGGFGELP